VSFTTSPIQFTLVLATALVAALVALLVVIRRGPWLTTLVFAASALSTAAFEAGTLGILQANTPDAVRSWSTYLARSSALAAWLWLTLSVVLARTEPWRQIRHAAAYLALALAGCLGMSAVAGSPQVIRDVIGAGGDAVVVFGTLGKVYLMYLVVVLVAVLMNLERMLRTAQVSAQRRLRPMFLAFLVGIFSQLLVISTGLLFGELKTSWLVASSAPVFVSGVAAALALGRRRLLDVSIPGDRPVFQYSSVSLTLASAFLLSMAVLSKVLPILTPEWKRFVGLAFYAFVGGGGLLLILSPRASREVRRFIDRSLYASRYDYRREWERVSNALVPATMQLEDVCRQIETLVSAAFGAERLAIYLREDRDGPMWRIHGSDAMPETIAPENPLMQEFERSRGPLVLRDVARDLDLIPVAVENRSAIQALSAAMCLPLVAGDRLVGTLWLSEKRNHEEYPFEDVEYLSTMSRHIAAVLVSARDAERLADRRELDSLRRVSDYVMNQVSALSSAAEASRRESADLRGQVEEMIKGLRDLAAELGADAQPIELQPSSCAAGDLVREALSAAGLKEGGEGGVMVKVHIAVPDPVVLDPELMRRALAHVLRNAREAVGEHGEIEITAQLERAGEGGETRLVVEIRDSGQGLPADFIRTSLFRQFSSTKPGRLGNSLAECRAIVVAHGGTISISSRQAAGTTVRISIPASGPPQASKLETSQAQPPADAVTSSRERR
jgi:putative PEP-CTERM system histidine kinase